MAIAGDTTQDVETMAGLVNVMGFDPVPIGPLAAGIRLQPGNPVFGAHVDVSSLRSILAKS